MGIELSIAGVIPASGSLRPDPDQVTHARLVVAGHATDTDDLRHLLAALGLLGVKVCSACRQELDLGEFDRLPARHDGRAARCRSCTRIAQLRNAENRKAKRRR